MTSLRTQLEAFAEAGSRMRRLVVSRDYFSVDREQAKTFRERMIGCRRAGLTCVATDQFTDEENAGNMVIVGFYMGLKRARRRR